VSATGTATLTYQWQRNGVAITGAIGTTYTTPTTTATDSGASYRVIVTNGAGTTTSLNATLTVTAAVTSGTDSTGVNDDASKKCGLGGSAIGLIALLALMLSGSRRRNS
jgi:hypothetical protein